MNIAVSRACYAICLCIYVCVKFLFFCPYGHSAFAITVASHYFHMSSIYGTCEMRSNLKNYETIPCASACWTHRKRLPIDDGNERHGMLGVLNLKPIHDTGCVSCSSQIWQQLFKKKTRVFFLSSVCEETHQ